MDFHPAQLTVYTSTARFRVVACGRRFGKTTLAVGEGLGHAGSNPESVVWWVAPSYDLTRIGLNMVLQVLPSYLRQVKLAEKEIVLWNNSRLKFRTADNPHQLRGEGVDFLVIDEAAFVKEEAWNSALRPTLTDTYGRALLISTFNGENWFYDLYERGQDHSISEWDSFRFTTLDNPFIDPLEVDEARRTTPQAEFEQEYEANPLVYVGAVFPGEKVQGVVDRGKAGYVGGRGEAFAGLDWGYANETAFEVCLEDAEGHVHWLDERTWVATDLNIRCARIAELCARYDVEAIYADAAGATENAALAAALDDAGLRTEVVRVPFGKYKDSGIKTRRWFIENDMETMYPECSRLIEDTKRYRYKEDSEDVIKEHDHTVDAATAFYASRRAALIGERV